MVLYRLANFQFLENAPKLSDLLKVHNVILGKNLNQWRKKNIIDWSNML